METTTFFDGTKYRSGIVKVCQQCGDDYVVRADRADRSRYCQRGCKDAARSNRVVLRCASCGDEFERDASKVRDGVQFCSDRCKRKEHRKGGLIAPAHYQKQHLCVKCGGETSARRRLCEECRAKRTISEDTPISAIFYDGRAASKYCRIRDHAVKKMSSQPQVCEATGYERCVYTCHIVPISAFSSSTPLGVVNDKRNLILLSPTPHWELDHGHLKPADVGREWSFREWVDEAVIAGYIPEEYRK